MRTWLVTGGAGFIGSCFVRSILSSDDADQRDIRIINLDKLTYAGHIENIPDPVAGRYELCEGDIADASLLERLLAEHQPSAIINFAAESHVDRSIDGPSAFVNTNVVGTATVLEQSLQYFRNLPEGEQSSFRLLHVSTDEVYGSLGPSGYFTEHSPYQPNSPYAASKASSDMFVRAYHETYHLPTLITNCSNNYGPYQFPEKLIPLMILNAVERKPLPVYGDGANVRDWLFVDDHCDAIMKVLRHGRTGETYNIGGNSERTNLEVVGIICELVDEFLGRGEGDSSKQLIEFVRDRPGHDRRYAIDATKIAEELGWNPSRSFEQGMRETVAWYLQADEWIGAVFSRGFERERLGMGEKTK